MIQIFNPAIYFANKLNFGKKFLFLGLIFLVVILFLGIVLFQQLNKTILKSESQLIGIDQVVEVNRVIQLVQQYRGLSAGDKIGRASCRERVLRLV